MYVNCGECGRRYYCQTDPAECDNLSGPVFTNADKIRSMSDEEWISVDDRLPEFGVSVLARCFYHGKWRTLVCHTSKENFGEWYTDEVCQWVKVTHWMPLPPELQKGE